MNYLPAWQKAAAISLFCAAICCAVDTHIWDQSDQSDFERGTRKGLSLRSDGHVTLAPEFKELASAGVPYLWALAEDSHGDVYYAGGAPTGASTKIFVRLPDGKTRTFAELPGLEVHALAIDKQDQLYAAVLPDAKIFRIDHSGKPQLFFDPKCKYIWALAFDKTGNLFAATGDAGLIYKITPDGHGSKFFDTQETHARSLAIDDSGNLIVGTDPGGIILRISPAGQGFVLYQAAKREITAVATHNGMIYAAAIGSKPGPSVSGTPPVLPTLATPTAVTATGAPRPATQAPALAPAVNSFHVSITGGSDLYRIQADGFAERIWSSPSDLIYALAFDRSGAPLLGTGNRGIIYRVDSDHLSTELLNAAPTQVTAFLTAPNGAIYAATGNVGNLYSIGPALEPKGTLESSVLNAGEFAYWGKAHLKTTLEGGTAYLETRSGNVNNPQNSWSAWSSVPVNEQGGAVSSPPARFLQYRLTLTRGKNDASPDLTAIDIPFLPKNVAPRVEQVELAPFNYRQPASSNPLERTLAASGSPLTISLPALGRKRTNFTLSSEPVGATLQYSKGFLTIRWSAADPNNDSLVFKVELRRENSSHWQVLKDSLQDRFYAFDTTAFADGQYIARITASDAPANPPAQALSSSLLSDPFLIDNTPPVITGVAITKNGTARVLKLTATDALSWIDKAEYSVDGGPWIVLEPDQRVTDSQTLPFTINGKENQNISVRVFDEDDNSIVRQFPLQ